MPICADCGKPAGEADAFCPHCGHRLAEPLPTPLEPATATWTPAPAPLTESKEERTATRPSEDRSPGLGCYVGAAVGALGSLIILVGLTFLLSTLARDGVIVASDAPAPSTRPTGTPARAVAIELTPSPAPPKAATNPPPSQTPRPAAPESTATVSPSPSPRPSATVAPTDTPGPTAPVLTGAQYLDEYRIVDDFSSVALGWSQKAGDDIGRVYVDGAYVIYDDVGMYVASDVPVDFTPTSIQFDAQLGDGMEDGEYGVICHYQDGENWDGLAIHPIHGSYHVAQLVDNEYFNVTDPLWQPASAIDTEPYAVNTVTVECLEDEIGLFINQAFIGRWTLPTLREPSGMALYVYGYYDGEEPYQVIFDNVSAWIPVQ